MPKQTLLIVTQHFWPEAFRINDISDYLIERDVDIDVLCGIPNYPKGRFFDGYSIFKKRRETHNDINIRRACEIPRGKNTNLHIFLNYISFPIASIFHVPRLLTKKYDKILLYQLSPVMMTITGIIVGKIKRTETTMYVLDLWPENLFSVLDIKNKLLRKLITHVSHWHYRNVDKLIVLSERMRQQLIDVTGISEDKITIIPQACEKIYETNTFEPELVARFEGKFNILYAGNISPAQSFETIIDAAKLIKKRGLDNINWIIVGDGMSRKWLEKEVKKANLQDNFIFEGQKPIEDIPKYTYFSDVLVGCLVKSELLEATIPAKVMSYLAAGKPLALAMDGEVQELVNNTIHCGFASPTEDSTALADSIQQLHQMSPLERKSLGKNASDYHMKHFERNLVLSKLYSFIFG